MNAVLKYTFSHWNLSDIFPIWLSISPTVSPIFDCLNKVGEGCPKVMLPASLCIRWDLNFSYMIFYFLLLGVWCCHHIWGGWWGYCGCVLWSRTKDYLRVQDVAEWGLLVRTLMVLRNKSICDTFSTFSLCSHTKQCWWTLLSRIRHCDRTIAPIISPTICKLPRM